MQLSLIGSGDSRTKNWRNQMSNRIWGNETRSLRLSTWNGQHLDSLPQGNGPASHTLSTLAAPVRAL